MRSRYSAFSKKEVGYLVDTWHPSKRREISSQSILKSAESCDWLSLTILDVTAGQPGDTEGFVEFLAIFKTEKLGALQERSRFIQEDGRWLYLDGEQKKPTLPGRNDPCWCGSGKKSKKCHGSSLR
jgi:SEC-C motif-containing protein